MTAAEPRVLISSRDATAVPAVAGAVRLEKAATAAGWAARQTYALAELPQVLAKDGGERTPQRQLASVAVRISRGHLRAFAIWDSTDSGPWRFSMAFLGSNPVGLRDLTKALV